MFSANLSSDAVISIPQSNMEPSSIVFLCTVIRTSVHPSCNTAFAALRLAQLLMSSSSRRGNAPDKSLVYRGVTEETNSRPHSHSHLGRTCKQRVEKTPGLQSNLVALRCASANHRSTVSLPVIRHPLVKVWR